MKFSLKKFQIDISVTRIANIHYFEFTKQYHTYEDSHHFRELVYVDSGSIMVNAEGYQGTLLQKQLIIHKSDEMHSLSCIGDEAPNVIIIGFECSCEKLDCFSQAPVQLSDDLIKLLTGIIKEGRTVFLPPYDLPNLRNMKKRKSFPFGADQLIKLKLENLLIELVRSKESLYFSQDNEHLDMKAEEICTYITNNFSERITLNELCFIFSTNKSTLCKSFKDSYGDTIINYINKLRIKEAKRLMRKGELNLTQISEAVGFSSIHYFCNVFKSIEGKSPTKYIDTIKAKLDS